MWYRLQQITHAIDAVWPLLKNLYLTLIFLIPIPLKAVVTPIKIAAVLSAHNTLS